MQHSANAGCPWWDPIDVSDCGQFGYTRSIIPQ